MNLNKEIVRLSVPAIISNITVPILGLSDTTISGHLGSEIYIGAIAVGTMMFNVVFWLFGFLRMGTTGLTAQAYGANNSDDCRRLLIRASLLGVVIGIVILSLQYPIKLILLYLISPDSEVSLYAASYFDICIWDAPALLFNMAVMGWFLGMQNTFRPMVISIAVNIINILLSLLFVFVFNLGFEGVAYGTLLANWSGVIISLLYIMNHYGWKLPKVMKSDLLFYDVGRFFKINTDIMFRSACIMAVSLSVTSIGAQIGALTLAANAIIMQFFILFSYFMDGFAFAAEALSGRFAGAKDQFNLNRMVKSLMWWALSMAIIFTLIYCVGHQWIVSLITSETDVVAIVEEYSIWLKLMPIVTVAAFVFDGIYIGLTATRKMFVVTFLSSIIFFCICFLHPFSTSIFGFPDNNTLWFAFLLYLLMRGVLLGINCPILLKNIVKSS